MALANLLNTAWLLKCLPEAWAFRRATRRVAATQAELLRRILHANRDTAFGRQYCFSAILDPPAYQQRVPLSTYEDYTSAIERIGAGKQDVLTHDRVELLEPTSGTTAGEKLIPYTSTLRRQFQRAVAAWMADLLRHRPAVRRGRAYWSISPQLSGPRCTAAGIRIGFDDDAAYLGTLERFALRRLLVAPPRQSWTGSLAPFRYATLLALLAAGDLSLISVWNPMFLTAIFTSLAEWQERLCLDLAKTAPARAAVVLDILSSRLSLPDKLRLLWPGLVLLSCWTDAAAARCLGPVRELFPWIEIQPKGLLATEGCVSFPLLGRVAPVLAVRSHFFEFEEADTRPRTPRLAHEVETGGCYRVILTTGGGLYRYQLRDLVVVAGWENRCPLLRFMGKADLVSDLVGEKLAETHVRQVLERVFRQVHLTPAFALLVPVADMPPRYTLCVQEATGRAEPLGLAELQTALQAGLEENPHYRYAVALGQLAPVEICVLPKGGPSGWALYEAACLARGQRAGDIKPVALDGRPGWADVFGLEAVSPGNRGHL
jgi:hypothetical protein